MASASNLFSRGHGAVIVDKPSERRALVSRCLLKSEALFSRRGSTEALAWERAQTLRSSASFGVGRYDLRRGSVLQISRASSILTVKANTLNENEYVVVLEKPIGIKFFKGSDGGVYVDALAPGQGADMTGKMQEGDKVIKTSAIFGDEMWPAAEYGRTMYTIRQRAGLVTMKLEKRFGVREGGFNTEAWKLERNAGNYGDAVREKQIENYLKKQELAEQRKEELESGLALYKQGKFEDALIRFETVLGLQPPLKEEAVASYNTACCYSKLGKVEAGLSALEAAMQAGFEDYREIRSDPDLATLRASPEFTTVINKFDEPFINENALKAISSVFGLFGGGKK